MKRRAVCQTNSADWASVKWPWCQHSVLSFKFRGCLWERVIVDETCHRWWDRLETDCGWHASPYVWNSVL